MTPEENFEAQELFNKANTCGITYDEKARLLILTSDKLLNQTINWLNVNMLDKELNKAVFIHGRWFDWHPKDYSYKARKLRH